MLSHNAMQGRYVDFGFIWGTPEAGLEFCFFSFVIYFRFPVTFFKTALGMEFKRL